MSNARERSPGPGIRQTRRLPCLSRVLALKALCEARLERDDIRGQIEDAVRPLKAHKQAAKAPADAPPSLDDFRR